MEDHHNHNEVQKDEIENAMERLKTPPKIMWRYILGAIALTVFLALVYFEIPQWWETWEKRVPLRFLVGAAVTLGLGHLGIVIFLKTIRNHIYEQTKDKEKIHPIYIDPLAIPGWLIGLIERIFFGALVTFDISATGAAMGTWMIVKMGTDWHRLLQEDKSEGKPDKYKIGPRSLAWGSLSAGVISLLFALIGGLICRTAIRTLCF